MAKKVNEALSKALINLVRSGAEHMSKELDISLDEALYVVSLYSELKDKNLFKTSYMQAIKLVADEGEKIPDITNIQQMVKYPNLMYDIIKYVLLESTEFTDTYTISYSNDKLVSLKLKKDSVETKKEAFPIFETPWDEYKVAEDENYITFNLTKYVPKLTYYYAKVFSEDPRVTEQPNSGFLATSWCVLSNPYHFESQRNDNSEHQWFVTFLKKNPIDFMIYNIKKQGSYNEDTKSRLIYNLENMVKLSAREVTELRNAYLGEIFLMHSNPDFRYPSANFGYHNYDNTKTSSESMLKVKPRYSYFNLESLIEKFTIQGGTLLSYNHNEEAITIPEGVVRIGPNAFVNKSVVDIVLPKSLTTIMNNAFINCSNLRYIETTNSLSYIQEDAFDTVSASNLELGVFFQDPDNGNLVVKKPASLQHYPKAKIMTKVQSESTKKVYAEAVRLLNKPLYIYDNKAFKVEHNTLFFKKSAEGNSFGDIVIPEGVVFLGTQIFGMYKSIVFPSTLKEWATGGEQMLAPAPHTSVNLLDFSKVTNIRVVEDKKFYFSSVRTILLPQSIVTIGYRTFFLTTASQIYIPSSVVEIDRDAFKNTNIMSITTDNVEVLKQKLENVHFRHFPEIIQA